MVLDAGGGRDPSPYTKSVGLGRDGAVYAVAGSSGQISGGPLNHPAMFISLNLLGSLVVDIVTNRMDVSFLDNTATVRDYFTITKDGTVSAAPAAPDNLSATALSSTLIRLQWVDNATDEDGFEIERSVNGAAFALIATVPADRLDFTDSGLSRNTRYYYRVRAFSPGGSSGYSNVANAKTRAR